MQLRGVSVSIRASLCIPDSACLYPFFTILKIHLFCLLSVLVKVPGGHLGHLIFLHQSHLSSCPSHNRSHFTMATSKHSTKTIGIHEEISSSPHATRATPAKVYQHPGVEKMVEGSLQALGPYTGCTPFSR